MLGSIPTGKPVVSFIPPYGLSSKIRAMPFSPRLYCSAIEKRESPSWTVYLEMVEKVAVGVIVEVDVMVGVSVGMDVLVGVNVMVGVGVSVAKSEFSGLLGPVSQTMSRITPPKTSKPAKIKMILGPPRFLRLRSKFMELDDEDEIGGLLYMARFLYYKASSLRRFPIRRNVK